MPSFRQHLRSRRRRLPYTPKTRPTQRHAPSVSLARHMSAGLADEMFPEAERSTAISASVIFRQSCGSNTGLSTATPGVKVLLQGAGPVQRARQRGVHRRFDRGAG